MLFQDQEYKLGVTVQIFVLEKLQFAQELPIFAIQSAALESGRFQGSMRVNLRLNFLLKLSVNNIWTMLFQDQQ